MDEEDMTPAYYHLKNGQQQADMDGIMVLVSRQAVEEVLSEYAGLDAKLDRLERENERLRDTLEYLKDRASYRCGLDEGWVETVCRAALESSDE